MGRVRDSGDRSRRRNLPPYKRISRGILMTVSVVISMIGLRGEGLVERLAPLRALWLLFVWLWVLRNRL